MKSLTIAKTLAALTLAALAMPSFSAVFAKYDGIDGESQYSKPAANAQLKAKPNVKPVGLLLPAVQQVREAARRSDKPKPKKSGNVESTWKVEKGEK